jgi:DNA-binding MarR family transcriptional regulator
MTMPRDTTWATDEQRRSFRSIYTMLTRFREQDETMPVQQMLVFCYIALNEGSTQRDLIKDLDMASSTSSRNIAALSPVHRLGTPGLALITWTDDPQDRRAKLLVLTAKGRAFAHRLLETL